MSKLSHYFVPFIAAALILASFVGMLTNLLSAPPSTMNEDSQSSAVAPQNTDPNRGLATPTKP